MLKCSGRRKQDRSEIEMGQPVQRHLTATRIVWTGGQERRHFQEYTYGSFTDKKFGAQKTCVRYPRCSNDRLTVSLPDNFPSRRHHISAICAARWIDPQDPFELLVWYQIKTSSVNIITFKKQHCLSYVLVPKVSHTFCTQYFHKYTDVHV